MFWMLTLGKITDVWPNIMYLYKFSLQMNLHTIMKVVIPFTFYTFGFLHLFFTLTVFVWNYIYRLYQQGVQLAVFLLSVLTQLPWPLLHSDVS